MNDGPWGARMLGFMTALALVAAACVLVFGWQRLDATDSAAATGGGAPSADGDHQSAPAPPPQSYPTESHESATTRSRSGYSATGIDELLTKVRIVAARPHVPGYDRDCGPGHGCVFGTDWSDDTDAPDGHNGCDTRDDVLREQLIGVAFKADSHHCDVVAGHLADPYTGVDMDYATEGSQIQVDHIFPLAAAWDLGASGWTLNERSRFANDTELELLAVNGSANMSKGDSTPASWLPPVKSFRCEYVSRYLGVAVAYGLEITEADRTVIEFVQQRTCAA